VQKHEKKPTANRRESALRANKIGFALPHFRNPASLSCSFLIGNVRANPVGAPAPPNDDFLLRLISRWSVKEHFSYLGLLDESIPHRSRWGGDRICPNAPDEGTSCWVERGEPIGSPLAEQGFALRLDPTSESEEQQIRF